MSWYYNTWILFEGGGGPPGRYFMRGVWGRNAGKVKRVCPGPWASWGRPCRSLLSILISSSGRSWWPSWRVPVCVLSILSFSSEGSIFWNVFVRLIKFPILRWDPGVTFSALFVFRIDTMNRYLRSKTYVAWISTAFFLIIFSCFLCVSVRGMFALVFLL